MSVSRKTYVNPNNMFEDDDDGYGTYDRLRRSQRPTKTPLPCGNYLQESAQHQDILQKQREIKERSLKSTENSLKMLQESENNGIATARELIHQGEQLQNTKERLNEMNANLKQSGKHLNGMQSFFYRIKNYFTDKSDRNHTNEKHHVKKVSPSKLNQTVHNLNQSSEGHFKSHPSTRLFDLDAQSPSENSQSVDDRLGANLNEIGRTIDRLKDLGTAFAEEIVKQNDDINVIFEKVNKADIKICEQTHQMNKILDK